MFTIKFYSSDGFRQIIEQADSFTILRSPIGSQEDYSAEITMHRKNGDDRRIDVGDDSKVSLPEGFPPRFGKAIIENAAGKTTEIITAGFPSRPHRSPKTPIEFVKNGNSDWAA